MINHFSVSLIKSVLRLVACAMLFYGNLVGAAVAFAAAEVLGVVEEMV